jgi:large subunit ribosomal protein L30
MSKLKLTLVKSTIDRPQDQKDTVRALGIRKVYHSVEKDVNPQIMGMVNKVRHLLKVEEI